MSDRNLELKKKANWVRNRTLEMCLAGGGHLASSFSCAEILVSLYCGDMLRFNPKNPKWDERDRFVLSKGHAAPALYALLADAGFFPHEELNSYCKSKSLLGSHPDRIIPGVEASTGSLGHGLAIAAGMAQAAKMDDKDYMTVVLLGDGECSEGAVWESALFAHQHRLNNLIGIVDRNLLCTTDFTEGCIGLDSLADKWKAFGWRTLEINGHSFEEILGAFRDCRNNDNQQPLMIIAHTVKGKGVSFMENDPIWHTKIPSGEQIELARKELLWREDESI